MKRLVLLLVLILVWAATPVSSAPTTRYLFGVINDEGLHYDDEWARGVRATTFELQWKLYEPQPGVYDQTYIQFMQQSLAQLKAKGWYVQLVPGYQYVPDWVFQQHPDFYYVNQYGERYDPDPVTQGSFRVINAPFNPQARALIAGYIQRIFTDFNPADFDSVRVGGVVQGELRYPPPDWNGHTNSYWAFDTHAQNPVESGIPAAVVGWRPGIDPNPGSVNRGQLIVNPGFEDTHSYYPVPGWSPDDEVTVELTTTDFHSGNRALKLTTSTPHRVHQYVRVSPNTTYNFGGWLKSADGVGRARVFFNQYDANTQPVAGAPFGVLETSATAWTYRTGTLTTSATTRYLKVELDGHQPGTFYFDDLWLERQGETNHQSRDIAVPLAFYGWYVQKLTDYQNWQIAEIRKYYSGQLDVLYAGKGLMPNQVTDALTNDLRGDGWSEETSALYSAAAYDRHAAGLTTTQNIALYLTGIDEPPAHLVDDTSPYPSDWSAARWIAHLAQSRGLPAWGENSGQDDATKLELAAQRMRANGFLGLMWAFESELYANPNPNGYATIADYEAIIATYNCTLPGDVDNDGDVDAMDIQAVAGRWHDIPVLGNPHDLDGDGDIDVVDVMKVSANWGRSCGAPATTAGRSLTSTPVVRIVPTTKQAPAAGTVLVDVVVEDATDLGGFEFRLGYDPALLQVLEVEPGPFLASTGRFTGVLGPIHDDGMAAVAFGGYSYGGGAGPSGKGVLATVVFHPLGPGTTPLTLTSGQLSDTTGRSPIPQLQGSTLTLVPPRTVYLPIVLK